MRSIDDILFSLIILQGLCNSTGKMWRCLPTQYYLIEIVIPQEQVNTIIKTSKSDELQHDLYIIILCLINSIS